MEWKDLIPWKRWGTKRPEVVESEQHPMLAMQRDMNRVFDDFHRSFFGMEPFESSRESFWHPEIPRIDVEESRKEVEVTAEVPGLSEKDIQLTLSPAGDVLFLEGERKHESKSKDEAKGWQRTERYYGVIHRSIQLPCVVIMDGAEARLKNGELRVRLVKREDSPEAKRISIKAG